MADTIKILGQTGPAATTDTVAYTVPANTSAVVTAIWACEINGAIATIRMAILPKGGVVSNENYIYFDKALAVNQTFRSGGGITLAQGDQVMVRSSTGDVMFSVFGMETTRAES